MAVFPNDPFTISELHNPLYNIPELHTIFCSPDPEALKLFKGRSGWALNLTLTDHQLGNIKETTLERADF